MRFTDEMRAKKLRQLLDMVDVTNIVLQPNDCSRLHRLNDALETRKAEAKDPRVRNFDLSKTHVFVVKHDWRAALDGADPADDEIRLPFDRCAFEFRVDGLTYIMWTDTDAPKVCGSFVEYDGVWHYMYPGKTNDPLVNFFWQQIKAICVALDAEVAVSDVIRAPHKLNEKRRKAGKAPLADYHVVDLARRHRVARGTTGKGSRPRLHFRRGHWRHYKTHKTWIRWTLAGNPDLGFVSKHYTI